MTHELILTSVSQGLEPNRRGFCAVAEDQAIPGYLRMRLETFSEFQHLFSSDSEDVDRQPVVYSHLIFPGQKTTWHALSRVADAGIDFQSRPNRLAHHIALENHEFVPEGPAWLLALPGFHVTNWLTPSVRFSQGRPLPTLTAPPPLTRRQRIARERRWLDPKKMCPDIGLEDMSPDSIRAANRENDEQVVIAKPPSSPCPSWRELTGDPGWGGVLAETIRTGQEAVLVFRPGQNLLPLYFEALSLLPPSFFWRASFSTWFTHLPEHVACHWKGALVGSPQAALLEQNRDLLIIDLTAPMGLAPTGPYVEFARTGIDGTLPSDEEGENLFESDTGSDTKPYTTESAPDPTPTPEIVHVSPEGAVETPAPPVSPTIPPIVITDKPGLHARSSSSRASKSGGIFGKLLNTKSQQQFYILYGVTFLLVLFLFALVLDQMLDFGLIRWFRGPRPTPQIAAPKTPSKKADQEKAVAAQDERIREQYEQRERRRESQRAAKQQKRDLLAKASRLRDDFDKQKRMNRESLDHFLLDHQMPSALSMPLPTVKGNLVDPPAPKIFPELAPLYPYGLALALDYQPLLDIPNIRIKTEKLKFTDTLEATDKEADETSKLGKTLAEGESVAEVQPDAELEIPNTSRFEWIVSAVENETKRETPMFHLKLTKEGLEISWMLEGMTTQYLYNTLTAALGFLRVGVEDEKNLSRIQSIAMFEPKTEKPIMVAERFADQERPEFDIFMPFAVQPWKALFETPVAPFVFRLEVTASPDTVNVTEDTDSETASPDRFFGLFETDIQSALLGPGGAVQYEAIEIAIEGRVGAERITWTDRYMDRVNELNRELEQNRSRFDQSKVDADLLQSELLNFSRNEKREERQRLKSLREEGDVLTKRRKQIEDILKKLPEAHDKIVKNQELRFDFAVHLVPVSAKPVADPEDEEAGAETVVEDGTSTAESDRVRLRNEESLLILRTVAEPKKTEKKEEVEVSTE